MYYFVIPPLKKVIAMSPKCGCSSVTTQILCDLSSFNETTDTSENENALCATYGRNHILIKDLFPVSPNLKNLDLSNYVYEWYVRDPFTRMLSCFLHKKSAQKSAENCCFRDFVFNFEQEIEDKEIFGHVIPQCKNYFKANWIVYNVEKHTFKHNKKLNSSSYSRGFLDKAWSIPLSNLFENTKTPLFTNEKVRAENIGDTYSRESFFSKEIFNEVKRLYADDYELLHRYNFDFYKPIFVNGPKIL